MFTKLLQPYLVRTYPVSVEEIRSSKQKEKRIVDTLEPVMNQHRLIIDQKVVESDFESAKRYPVEQQNRRRLFYQMSRITKDKDALAFDDRLDALAMAVAYWAEKMGADEDERMERRREELRDIEMQAFTGSLGLSLDQLVLAQEKGMDFRQVRPSGSHGRWSRTHH